MKYWMYRYRVPFFATVAALILRKHRALFINVSGKKVGIRARSNIKYKHQSFRRYQCKVHTSINDRCPHEGYSISCVVCNVISINYTSNKALETYSYISWTSTYFLYEIFHSAVFTQHENDWRTRLNNEFIFLQIYTIEREPLYTFTNTDDVK